MLARPIIRLILFCLIIIVASGCFSFYLVEKTSAPYLSYDINALPHCKTGLVLGTSKRLANGTPNLYFTFRMDAAEKLFKSGKVEYLILSGDNRANHYNEPRDMQRELIKRGIPDSCLVLDYAGLRTFDSMVRCHEIFGQDSVIVVSQQFHNARAVYIGQTNGLRAFGLNAQKVTTQSEIKIKFREFFSRIKCLLDIYLLNTKPRHLGQKIIIGEGRKNN